jgi:hypothetical protein
MLSICLIFTSPLHNQYGLLTQIDSARLIADNRLSFILHTVTGFHWLSLTHYYGFICHLTPTSILSLLLIQCFQPLAGTDARFPQLLH